MINSYKGLTHPSMTTNQEDLLVQALIKIFEADPTTEIFPSELVTVELPDSKSRIINDNSNIIYVAKIKKLEGLFIKEAESTRLIGRYLCDLVKEEMKCNGFFTSDELPRYGITRAEVSKIFSTLGKKKNDRDLLIIYAYDLAQSIEINEFLKLFLTKKIADVRRSISNGQIASSPKQVVKAYKVAN